MTSRTMAQTSEVTDEALAVAARGGDQAAFALLASRYRDTAFAYAYARLRRQDEAEDIVQEAFVRAFLALDRFRASESWGAWQMSIVRNLCTDALRRRRGGQVPLREADGMEEDLSPERFALAREQKDELNAAVATLPEKYRLPLLMHYGSGRTYREIALALDVRESTVTGRLAGALQRLRRRLRTEDGP